MATQVHPDELLRILGGIALWLAVAYHETKNTPHPSIKPHHRDLMRLLRELKEDHRADPIREWTQAAAAA